MEYFLLLLVSFAALVSATDGRTKITAEPGENVTLPCRTKNNHPVLVVEWIRNDMGELKHVALYRDGRFDKNGQDPTYENRVDLQDREMKDGDVSLVLMNVTTNHTGTYECRVIQRGNKRRKRSNIKGDPICIISLDVAPRPPSGDKGVLQGGLQEDGGNEDGGNKDGGNSAGLIAGIIVEEIHDLYTNCLGSVKKALTHQCMNCSILLLSVREKRLLQVENLVFAAELTPSGVPQPGGDVPAKDFSSLQRKMTRL
ncbi:PREDICTED: uncharacterized protein LOC107104217 [Cyprinodon variegatus]|uniref:uncharacterized protein LOC107104217 n=1 Tax=Cyprinodon variegatus TaxID=28743 RepID=UPI00074299E4|nr:PREDICTED: uncharacterized protein LOC107104217 [Cyprinodon variegatus]